MKLLTFLRIANFDMAYQAQYMPEVVKYSVVSDHLVSVEYLTQDTIIVQTTSDRFYASSKYDDIIELLTQLDI